MKLTMISRDEGVVRLACEGHLTAPALDGVADPLERALGPDDFRRTVLLDLGRSLYLNSSGISWLIESERRFRLAGGRLVLHSLTPPVTAIARLTHLASLLPLADDEPSARSLAPATDN
jgi:anti-anti-sigma factor